MPPQKPVDDFEPDDFEEDDFEPDDFEADTPAEPSGLESFWNSISQPLSDYPSRVARSISSGMNARLNDTVGQAQLRGFGAGALEGIGDLASGFTSPLSLASFLLSGGSSVAAKTGLSGLARVLDIGAKGAGIPSIAHGGYKITDPESTSMERAFGAMELAGGASAFAPLPKATPKPVEPLPIPREPLALPPGRYTAGPGGVARPGDTSPLVHGNMEGTPRAVKSGLGTALDPELKRQADIFYTEVEQAGGKRMFVPDSEAFAQAGDTSLGFEPISRSDTDLAPNGAPDLPYPFTVVPERLRPRTAQTVTRALAGDRFDGPIAPREKVEFASGLREPPPIPAEPSIDLTAGGTAAIRPGENILPSAPKPTRAAPHTVEVERGTTPTTFGDRVAAQVAKDVDPVIPGASGQVKGIVQKGTQLVRDVAEGLFTSGEKQLERMGPAGQTIRRLLSGVEYTKRELYNKFASPYIEATKRLTPEEQANFVDAMEGAQPPMNPNVANAVAATRKITDEMGQMAIASGVRMKTPQDKTIAFKPIKEYWPHRPVNPMNRDTFIDELMANNPKLSRGQAQKLAGQFMAESEWFNSPQHARMFGDFEYRKDLAAMTDHMGDMADIIARAQHLGPGDIGNPNSIISKAAEVTPNPNRAIKLIRTHLRGGMDKNDTFYKAVKKVTQMATKFQVFSKLGLFPISNINNQMPTMLWSSTMKEFSSGLMDTMSNSPTLKSVAKDYGTVSVGEVPIEMIAEAGSKPVPIVGGLIRGSEAFARNIATGAGRGTAKALFKSAQAGDRLATIKLQNLLLNDDITAVLKQAELSPDQLKFATNRFVELSQQLNSNMKLPPAWVNEPLLGLPLIFKKYAFQGTKSVYDAIMQDPKRNIPLFLIASPLLGELTGDLKSIVYGVVRGAPAPDGMLDAIAFELAGRHKFAEKMTGLDSEGSDIEWLTNRIAADFMQSWGLGLIADGLQGLLGGENSGYAGLAGPAIEQAVKVGTAIPAAAKELTIGNDAGTYPATKELGREGLRSIPILGPGLQRRILPYQSQEMEP